MTQVSSSEALDERRFGGLQRLYGMQGAQRIRQAHVVVVGGIESAAGKR